ncbi:MAG: preprotein translocase subunit YajC [Streptomycetaceae bacterium]|nr:preprotein translocase subunit YajC [Streptomycetaceae bacterium]
MDILTLLPILLIFVVIYFFMIKPAKKRQQEAVQTQRSLQPGSEVRTIAGLFATVTEVEDDSVILEIAPGVHSRYLKSAIAAVLSTGDEDEDITGYHHEGTAAEGDAEHDEDGAHEDEDGTGTDAVDLGKKAGDGEDGAKDAGKDDGKDDGKDEAGDADADDDGDKADGEADGDKADGDTPRKND